MNEDEEMQEMLKYWGELAKVSEKYQDVGINGGRLLYGALKFFLDVMHENTDNPEGLKQNILDMVNREFDKDK